jgi:hypothetical protein
MWKALAIKELREVSGIAAIALALGLALFVFLLAIDIETAGLTGIWHHREARIPFVEDTFPVLFAFLAAAVAIALGFRQSLGEAIRGTYPFLLHLPLPRGGAILTKVVIGIVVYLVCSAFPILLHAGWAATPGTHPSPFLWTMTDMTVRLYLTMPVLYLGSFLTGIRDARWIGTRLFPFAGTVVLAVFVQLIPCWWIGGVGVLAAVILSLVACICHVAHTRDF